MSHDPEEDPQDGTLYRTQIREKPDADAEHTRVRAAPLDSDAELTRVRPAASAADAELTRVRATPSDSGATRARVAPADSGRTRSRPAAVRAAESMRAGPEQAAPPLRAPTATFGAGYLLRERYQLIESIGRGAMGEVWKARDTYIAKGRNRFVAIKVFRTDFQNHPRAYEAMQAEASRAMQLAHPNIVTVHILDIDTAIGRPFIVMELLEGQPLDKLIRDTGGRGVQPQKAWPIIKGMSEGLAYAHRKGLVHSDFKPANVFLTSEGVPKVLDFGIARAVRHPGSNFEDEAVLSGYTTMYAAPEVLEEQPADTSDDVFALGLLAYELLAGRHPFNRTAATEVRERKLQPQPIKGLKRREWRAIEKALALSAEQRFADAAAFLRALQGLSVLQSSLIAAVVILSLAAGGFWYRDYLNNRPAVAFEDLPLAQQQAITAALADGHRALRFVKEDHAMDAVNDAVTSFGTAYDKHPRDPDAMAGLNDTADAVIEWAASQPDKALALSVLQGLQAKSPDYYKSYKPLTRAIERAQSR